MLVLRMLEVVVYLPLLAFAIVMTFVARVMSSWTIDAVVGAVIAAYVVARRRSVHH
jgi:hypothetical protein